MLSTKKVGLNLENANYFGGLEFDICIHLSTFITR